MKRTKPYTIRYRGSNAPVYLMDVTNWTPTLATYSSLAEAEAGLKLAQVQEAKFAPGWIPEPREVYIGRS